MEPPINPARFSLTTAIVYLVASGIGSVAPTPGGLGAFEAALVACFVATGSETAAATATVLVYRGCTFWLPFALGATLIGPLRTRRLI